MTHKGLGLFAKRKFNKGEILWIIDDNDVKIPLTDYYQMEPELRKKLDIYSYMDDNFRVIIPWDNSKYVNHSCAPNSTGLSNFDNLSIALRDIEEGEEIVENYSAYFGHFESFQCACKHPNCVGTVSSTQEFNPDLRLDFDENRDLINAHEQYLLSVKTSENEEILQLLGYKSLSY
jgi:SET domain-containing protein